MNTKNNVFNVCVKNDMRRCMNDVAENTQRKTFTECIGILFLDGPFWLCTAYHRPAGELHVTDVLTTKTFSGSLQTLQKNPAGPTTPTFN